MTKWAKVEGATLPFQQLVLYLPHHPCTTPRLHPNKPEDDWQETSHVLFRFPADRLQIPHEFPILQLARLGQIIERPYILILPRHRARYGIQL